VFLAGYLAANGSTDEAGAICRRVLAEDPQFDARKVTKGMAAVSAKLSSRFDSALRSAGFDLGS